MPLSTIAPQPKKKTPPSSPTSLSGFRRVQIGLNVIIQIVVLAFILLMINVYAYKHFQRYDFSRDHKYALSQPTKKFLAALTKPVKIVVFMSEQSLLQTDVNTLVTEYRNAQPKYVSIELVEPFRNVTRAGEVKAKYKLNQQENVVVVDAGDDSSAASANRPKPAAVLDEQKAATGNRFKVVLDSDMAEVEPPNPMLGQTEPQIGAFKGEQAITNALLEVTEGKKSVVYYLRGHGEGEAKGQESPLGVVGALMDYQHIDLEELNLLNVANIPNDASVVMILGPSYDLSDGEIKMLSDYWDKNGRLLILLNPDAQTPRLNAFLANLGIMPEDDRLIGRIAYPGISRLTRDTVAQFVGGSPIAKGLEGVAQLFPGATQSLALAPARAQQIKAKLEPLLQSDPSVFYWGETEYQNFGDPDAAAPTFDEAKDKKGPLTIGATLEKGAVSDQNVQVNSGRLAVVGNSRFIQRGVMSESSADFVLSTINWLLAREQLIGIAPKKVENFTLNLPETQVQTIFWVSTMALPGFFALLGVLVWWRRRA